MKIGNLERMKNNLLRHGGMQGGKILCIESASVQPTTRFNIDAKIWMYA